MVSNPFTSEEKSSQYDGMVDEIVGMVEVINRMEDEHEVMLGLLEIIREDFPEAYKLINPKLISGFLIRAQAKGNIEEARKHAQRIVGSMIEDEEESS